jgi:His/Glu/Gln/Arg/opine family amino acid ABC transporter permease subunit
MQRGVPSVNLHFDLLVPAIPFILQGTWVTLEYMFLAAIISVIWGTILSIFKISHIRPLKWFGVAYTSVFRGTPLLVQLSIIYMATPQLTGYNITALQAGVLAFGLNSAAYVSETIRGGILAVDRGQREAALSLGVSYGRMMLDIILPQAVKNILPALVNESIALLKDTALVSTIGAADLLRRAEIVTGELYIYFEPLILVAAVYYVLVMILTWFGRMLERRLRRSD